ncbi:MAG: DUF4270 domain-containing protein [Chitinophagales bacterium]
MNNYFEESRSTNPVKTENLLMKYWLLIFSACSLLIWSCNETIPVGSEILPNSDGQGNFFSDTTTLFSTTVREDSLRSDKLFLSQLGFSNDPVFGKTKSSLMMGFRIPYVVVNADLLDTIGGYQLDSVVLSMKVNAVYGDSTKPMNFTVYKLISPLSNEEPYFSNINFQQSMLEVGRIENYIPKLNDEFEEDTLYTELGHQLRIHLSPFFGQSLINILGTNQITSNALLHQLLPGLVVVPDEQDGSILEIDVLTNALESTRVNALQDTRLHLYYKNANAKNLDLMFPATALDLGISQYKHDYSSTNVETALNSTSPTGDAVNYIQGLAGVKTKIEFPYLASYGNIAVQKAELVITRVTDGFEETYSPPERLFAVKIGDDGTNENISDFIRFSDAHIGGFSNEITLQNGQEVLQYRLNISDHIQDVITGKEPNNGMFITLYGAQDLDFITLNNSDLIPDRIVIGGGSNSLNNFRLKLEMTFANLD